MLKLWFKEVDSGLLIDSDTKPENMKYKQEGGFLGAMMVAMAPSLRVPMGFSLIQRMRSSLIHAMSRKEFMRAEK